MTPNALETFMPVRSINLLFTLNYILTFTLIKTFSKYMKIQSERLLLRANVTAL